MYTLAPFKQNDFLTERAPNQHAKSRGKVKRNKKPKRKQYVVFVHIRIGIRRTSG